MQPKVPQFVLSVLVSRLVSDGESQAQSCVLIDGAAPVLAAHSTDGGKTCKGGQNETRAFCACHKAMRCECLSLFLTDAVVIFTPSAHLV